MVNAWAKATEGGNEQRETQLASGAEGPQKTPNTFNVRHGRGLPTYLSRGDREIFWRQKQGVALELKRLGETVNHVKTWDVSATFDFGHIRPRNPETPRKFSLRNSERCARTFHVLAKVLV
jgi:hypothetical protein